MCGFWRSGYLIQRIYWGGLLHATKHTVFKDYFCSSQWNVPCKQINPRAIFQNELIIQIMKESYEVDNLKRKVDDAKMKLITEIKVTISPVSIKQVTGWVYFWYVLDKKPSRSGIDCKTKYVCFFPYKLRKQAATELRDLKTELSQKKNQSSPSWMDWKHNTGQSTSLKQLLHRRQEDCSS